MLRSWWRQALVVVAFLLIASCSGGGCSSGCASCGITPLAGGFDPAKTIPNAASARVTQAGLQFLSANIPALVTRLLGQSATGGVIDYPIPTLTAAVAGTNVNICPNGSNPTSSPPICLAEIQLGNAALTLATATPSNVTLSGTIPIRVRDLQVTGIPVINGVDIALGSNGQCVSGGSDADFVALPISVTLPLVSDPIAPRNGYTMVDVKNAAVNITITGSDLKLCAANCGILGFLCNAILGLLPGTVAGALQGPLQTQIKNILGSALCTKANAALSPPCPIGSHPDIPDGGTLLLPDGGIPSSEPSCLYDADATQCVATELGLEGHINLGALLKSISPGTSGALDFMLAAGGDMNPANSGLTLGMLGGAVPRPQSICVPAAPNPAPTKLIIPDQMLTDTVPNWKGKTTSPAFGIALDGQFLNYFFGSAYNSGLLCLGVSTENFQQLNTGVLSLLVPSMKTLTFENKGASIAITTRPQKPPKVTIGGGTDVNKDPTLGILLPSFAIDFYVWSEDRYVRALTLTADVTIPLTLQSGASGLKPTLGTVAMANPVVTNNELLTEDPTSMASALAQVLGSVIGQAIGSGIPAINLSSALSSLGLTLSIPDGGIRKITQGSEDYLAIFGDLGIPGHPITQIETTARLIEKTVHPEAMALATLRSDLAPTLRVMFGSTEDGATPVEYSWRIDQGTWSAWSPERDVTVRDPMLYMQARHVLEVAARVAGQPGTEDASPATIPFTIDVLAPSVRVIQQQKGFGIEAWDVITPNEALVARTRGTDAKGQVAAWSDWKPLAETKIDPALHAIDVQVRDEQENVGSVSSALIRGGPDPSLPAAGGCSGCSTGSRSGTGWPAIVLGLAGLSALLSRRRTGGRAAGAMLALGSIVTVAASSQGCSCGSPASAGPGTPDGGGGEGGLPDGAISGTGCGADCNQPCGPKIPVGLIGAYTSIAKGADGTIWVAGYNDAALDPANGIDALYGDLVVGKYDSTKQAVQWVTVDGLPPPPSDGSCPANDPSGWRHGLLDSGPDVGLWTSLVLDASGHPMVSYYDATNQAVKFASSTDGVTWSTHAIYANVGSDVGRYSKMILANGNPVIAYLIVDTGTNGHSKTRVALAHANVPLPAAPSDWAVEDALVDDQGPCRAQDCATGQACVISTAVCATVSTGCDAACATGQACIDVGGTPTCTKVATSSDIHPYPNAVGDYVNLAATPTGLGLVVYDRIHGNLLGLTNGSGSWAVTVLDGETGSRANGTAVDTGNDGVGASLFVGQGGDWHVSYVDGLTESLKYLYVPGGTLVSTLSPQIVDDGSQVDGAPFSDGIHIVGDDSFVRQNADGSISITYQDATVGALRLATGGTTPGKWTLHALPQANKFAGFFPHFLPSDTPIANWWRWVDPTTSVLTGDVAIVSP